MRADEAIVWPVRASRPRLAPPSLNFPGESSILKIGRAGRAIAPSLAGGEESPDSAEQCAG